MFFLVKNVNIVDSEICAAKNVSGLGVNLYSGHKCLRFLYLFKSSKARGK